MTDKNQARAKKNKAAGLVRYVPTYWVSESERDKLVAELAKVFRPYHVRARRLVDEMDKGDKKP